MSIFANGGGGFRTNDPIFSFVIKGAGQDLFLRDTSSCFGSNCVYDVFEKNDGRIILFGNERVGYTFTHFIEEVARVPYRYFKNFRGDIIFEDGRKKHMSMDYYVRDLRQKSDLNVYRQIHILKRSHNFKMQQFANANIVCINARSYKDETLKVLNTHPYYLLG